MPTEGTIDTRWLRDPAQRTVTTLDGRVLTEEALATAMRELEGYGSGLRVTREMVEDNNVPLFLGADRGVRITPAPASYTGTTATCYAATVMATGPHAPEPVAKPDLGPNAERAASYACAAKGYAGQGVVHAR